MKRTQVIIGIVVGLITIAGALFAVDQRYAKSQDVELVSVRLELKILQDRYNDINSRIWKLEDRYRGQASPPEVVEEIRKLKQERDHLEKLINELIKKQRS